VQLSRDRRDVGIKSASVHYHFPTKTELGSAVVARYQERLLAMLGRRMITKSRAKIDVMRTIFLGALKRGEGMCLCGILATEAHSLRRRSQMLREPILSPATMVSPRVWTSRRCRAEASRPRTTALFQGAMLQAVSLVTSVLLKRP